MKNTDNHYYKAVNQKRVDDMSKRMQIISMTMVEKFKSGNLDDESINELKQQTKREFCKEISKCLRDAGLNVNINLTGDYEKPIGITSASEDENEVISSENNVSGYNDEEISSNEISNNNEYITELYSKFNSSEGLLNLKFKELFNYIDTTITDIDVNINNNITKYSTTQLNPEIIITCGAIIGILATMVTAAFGILTLIAQSGTGTDTDAFANSMLATINTIMVSALGKRIISPIVKSIESSAGIKMSHLTEENINLIQERSNDLVAKLESMDNYMKSYKQNAEHNSRIN